MLVLSGVFNTRILDATNYANQDYMRVNYTLVVVHTMLLVTGPERVNVVLGIYKHYPGSLSSLKTILHRRHFPLGGHVTTATRETTSNAGILLRSWVMFGLVKYAK
jgi:hypothetical protein